MSTFQILGILFILFISLKVLSRFRKKDISIRELIFWQLFWIIAIIVIALPQTTSWLATQVGVGRGVDLVIYIMLLSIVYALFRVNISLRRLNHSLTTIVREIALIKGNTQDHVE